MVAKVSIGGLQQARRVLRGIDRRLAREFDKHLKKAAQPIVVDARRNYNRFYTRRTGKTPRYGMRAVLYRGGSAIRIGGGRYGYAVGQEFGSSKHRYPQFRRATQHGGPVYFWPAMWKWEPRLEQFQRRAVASAVEYATRELSGR